MTHPLALILNMCARFLAAAAIVAVLGTAANSAATPVVVRLVNTTGSQVDYYLSASPPKFITSIAAGATADVRYAPGQTLLFGINRKLFQKYKVRTEAYQELALAPAGKQTPPKVATAVPGKAKPKPANTAADDSADAAAAPEASPQPEPQTGADDSGMKWQYSSYNDAKNNSKVLLLVYGVPETDGVQAVATCRADKKSGAFRLLLGADVSKSKDNAIVKIEIKGKDLARVVDGAIVRSSSSEGLEGFAVSLPADHEIATKMMTLASITYGLPGKKATRLELASGKATIRKFLIACDQFKGPSAKTAATSDDTSKTAAKSISCAASRKLPPVAKGPAYAVTFKNASKEYRHVDVVGPTGFIVDNGGLDPGQSMQRKLRHGQVVQFSDGPGNCIEAVVISKDQSVYAIRKPSPGFGDGND